jgi:hypothetical protein
MKITLKPKNIEELTEIKTEIEKLPSYLAKK